MSIKRRFSIIFLCLALLPLLSIAQITAKPLQKKTLLSDVNFMIENFEEIQVNPYLHISKKEFHRKTDSIFKLLPDNSIK